MTSGLTWCEPGCWRSASVEATQRLGEILGSSLEDGDVVILEGDLGAGKTQLTKGVARSLGVEDDIVSPTFTLCLSYTGTRIALHHLDLYRLVDESELGDAGALDVVGVEGASLVEWGGSFAELLSPDRLTLTIEREDSGKREDADAREDVNACGRTDEREDADSGYESDFFGLCAPSDDGPYREPARRIRAFAVGSRSGALLDAIDIAIQKESESKRLSWR